MIKGIIFDKDGVIFDSEPVYAKATIDALKLFGYVLTGEEYFEYWTRKGGDIEEFVKNNKLNIDLIEFKKSRHNLIDSEFKLKLPIIYGVAEALARFEGLYPLALVTSSDKKITDLKLDLSGFRKFFDLVITKEDVSKHKPHPDCFLLAGERLGIKPENLVVIEDAEKGLIAAKRAGMKCIAIPNKYTFGNDFSLADIILKDISKLTIELIKSL